MAARRASSTREVTSSLAKACRRWLLTVCWDRNSRSATCRFVSPLATCRADGLTQIQYIADLQASTRAAIASVDPTPYFQQYSPNAWAIFKAYLDAVSTQSADPVTAKYTGVLAAADVYTFLNAAAMLDSLRVDAGDLGPFGDHP